MASRKLARMLGSDKPPFFLAAFFAALAWSITQYSDSLISAPVIEYDVSVTGNEITVELENLTSKKTFSGLTFFVRTPGGRIDRARIVPTQPASEGEKRPTHAGEGAHFYLCDFHPGWKVKLKATGEISSDPTFQLERSNTTVLLLRPSLDTWMIRYYRLLLFLLLGIWAILTAFLVRKGIRDEPSHTKNDTPSKRMGDSDSTAVPSAKAASSKRGQKG